MGWHELFYQRACYDLLLFVTVRYVLLRNVTICYDTFQLFLQLFLQPHCKTLNLRISTYLHKHIHL